jgi:AraC-like DNA-binding protein
MKARLVNRFIEQTASFALAKHSFKNFLKVWHYHPELELVIVLESTGSRFVGDSFEAFKPGDIILIGKNLPHMWLNDKIYFEENNHKLKARAQVIHFHEDFAGGLFQASCMTGINDLLKKAKRGIKFQDNTNGDIIKKVNKMFKMSEYEKIISFIDILKRLSEQKNYKLLSSTGYISSFSEIRDSKIIAIYEYIMNNFKEEISLNKAADLANMNPAAFSRYFKNIHKSTFVKYLNEVRIGYACKLLIENRYKISEACYESGYNNISNFNRQFRMLKKMAPSEYLRLHAVTN